MTGLPTVRDMLEFVEHPGGPDLLDSWSRRPLARWLPCCTRIVLNEDQAYERLAHVHTFLTLYACEKIIGLSSENLG